MRFLLYVILISTYSVYSSAQTGKPLSYEEVVVIKDVNQEELFNRASMLLSGLFEKHFSIIVFEDFALGYIIAEGQWRYTKKSRIDTNFEGHFSYNISIRVKDGKYKFLINNYSHVGEGLRNSQAGYSFGIITDSPTTRNKTVGEKGTTSEWPDDLINRNWNELQEYISKHIDYLVTLIKEEMAIPLSSGYEEW